LTHYKAERTLQYIQLVWKIRKSFVWPFIDRTCSAAVELIANKRIFLLRTACMCGSIPRNGAGGSRRKMCKDRESSCRHGIRWAAEVILRSCQEMKNIRKHFLQFFSPMLLCAIICYKN